MAQKIGGAGKVWGWIFCDQKHPSLCQICAGFWCLLYFFCDDFEVRHYGLLFHGFRVFKVDSISDVFLPGFFGTKVEVFGPWFLCVHFSMDLTSKIMYPLLVGGVVLTYAVFLLVVVYLVSNLGSIYHVFFINICLGKPILSIFNTLAFLCLHRQETCHLSIC